MAATIDVILPALHGTSGEDGAFQGTIEFTGIPYACPNPLASANGMDKITMKMILKECGIPVVDYCWFSDKEWLSERDATVRRIEAKLHYPMIVKPANLGSSVGIKAVHDRSELIEAVDNAVTYSKRIIVETLIEQLKEINCSVLGDYSTAARRYAKRRCAAAKYSATRTSISAAARTSSRRACARP